MAKKLSPQEQKDRELKLEQIQTTSEKIFNMLFVEDELSWKDMIYALIDQEKMNPWDIDVSLLSQKFLEMLRKLKELDFRVSGKMVLASAILLKMKSDILKDEDIAHFDSVMSGIEENMPLDEEAQTSLLEYGERPQLFPRTPQPRQRKVSVFDLVQALEKALEVENRRSKIMKPNTEKLIIKLPEKHFDLGKSMESIYGKVETHYNAKKNKDKILTFDELLAGGSKHDKVLTFVPLLHLDNLRKVDLEQKGHFDQIHVKIARPRDTKDETTQVETVEKEIVTAQKPVKKKTSK